MRYLADFDELQVMAENMILEYSTEEIIENILNILRTAYIRGKKKTCEELDWEWDDYLLYGDWEEEVILKKFEGKDVTDRIREHVEAMDGKALARVIDTEYHRDYNTGSYDMAEYVDERVPEGVQKVWCTQMDDKVRETHDYLEGMKVPLDARFYSFDGDSARFPSDFANADNNINCRCFIKYSY